MFPNPTAEPATANTYPMLPENFPRLLVFRNEYFEDEISSIKNPPCISYFILRLPLYLHTFNATIVCITIKLPERTYAI